MTVADLTASFFATLGDGTRRVYEGAWARYLVWLELEGVALEASRPMHVSKYITRLRAAGNAKGTIGTALSAIREVYALCVREELLPFNPAREVKNPKQSQEPRAPWLTEEQVSTLLAPVPTSWKQRRARACICLLLGLGWRRAEVARLTVRDFKDNTVTGLVKGGKRLTVGVPVWLAEELGEWRTHAGITSGALLPRSEADRRPISGDTVYHVVKDAARAVGLTVSPHALRRTNITLLGELGVSLKMRQLAVGHTSSAITERYDRARDAAKNAPGEALGRYLKKKN